jgi:RNA polymerase sigma factor (sigma-70 family)
MSDLYLRSQTDARLLSLTRDGHGRAFAVLAERYRAELLGQARRMSSSANAEDLLQQTMLSAFAALDRGAEVGHARGWLHAILRHAATRARGPAEAPLELAVHTGETPDAMLEARADARLVLSALDELPTRQREALVGSSVQGLSRAELATTLGVSEGAVRQLVHRARSAVRAAVTSVTPYPVIRWLTGAGGSASPGPPELALASGAAGAGGVVAKLGMVAAAGAIAASGLAAPGHHAPRAGVRAGDRVHVTRGPSTTAAAVTAMRSGPPAPASGGEFVTARARGTGRAGAFTSPGDGSGRGHTGGHARGGQPKSTRGDEGSRGADATGRGPSPASDSGSGPGSAPGTSESSPTGTRVHSGSGEGGPSSGDGGSSSGAAGSSSGEGGSRSRGAGSSSRGAVSSSGGDGGAGGSGTGHGDTTTAATPSVPTPAATTATDGGGVSGRGDSNNGGGSRTATPISGTGADGDQTAETSTTSNGSRDLLPPAGSSLATDH